MKSTEKSKNSINFEHLALIPCGEFGEKREETLCRKFIISTHIKKLQPRDIYSKLERKKLTGNLLTECNRMTN